MNTRTHIVHTVPGILGGWSGLAIRSFRGFDTTVSLLLGIFVLLTSNDLPTEDGGFRPSVLLHWLGGWNDLGGVADAHLLPAANPPANENRALRRFRAAEAARPDRENPDVERIMKQVLEREDWDQEFAERMVREHARFFALVEELLQEPALHLPQPNFPSSPSENFRILDWPRLYQLRVRVHVGRSDWGSAVQALGQMNRLSGFLVRSEGPLVDYLVAMACEMQTLAEVQRLLDDPALPPASMPALRDLLHDGPDLREAMVATWKHEYRYQKQACHDLANGLTVEFPNLASLLFDQPLRLFHELRGAAARCLQQAALAVAFQPNRTAQLQAEITDHLIALSRLDARDRLAVAGPQILNETAPWHGGSLSNLVGERIVRASAPDLRRALDRADVVLGYRRALLAMWAVRHYHELHGELPDSLPMVRPRHLADVPLDPFDGKPLRFSPSTSSGRPEHPTRRSGCRWGCVFSRSRCRWWRGWRVACTPRSMSAAGTCATAG